jgi:hypothetical protein
MTSVDKQKDDIVRLNVWMLLAVAAVSLAGCSSNRVTYLPDGRKGYAISCGHFYQDWSSCAIRAGRLCRAKGYTVSYSDEVDRQMIVGCKEPPVVAAQ